MTAVSFIRPEQPDHKTTVWYRGWEISWNEMAYFWARAGWDAYKGGCDLDAPQIQSAIFTDLLDEIDAAEEDAA